MRTLNHRGWLILALGWIVFLSGAPGSASTTPPSLTDLIDQADLIVRGHVTSSETLRRGQRIVTRVQLAVDELYKGSSDLVGAEITIRVEGGFSLQGPVPVAALWAGRPQFHAADELLIFLRHSGYGEDLNVVGQSRGVFPLPSQATASGPRATGEPADLLVQLQNLLGASTGGGDS